ncbi:MAG TPA: imidazole glycerol phosphate synthase subunit HisH [Candidatus Blautia merdavium]|uniref:Imidazole glycerol phosphate synthase subunit HisH n=1 Tax=Candidatus Blautia merdavium TaxID=2838494 RepID=A0A9D2PNU5_9FIRM|nr:imidazole glycerol phosphate synthase subunit HisH [Candidatus Blautia merdavium]
MIAVIDYGAGNLFSVKNALDYLETDSVVTGDRETIEKADAVILPGVGAFPDAMRKLKESGLSQVIKEEAEKKPLLGICLGMQLLFERSSEYGDTEGLGLIPGQVRPICAPGLKIPHMGWNRLEVLHSCPMLDGIKEEPWVYFVHSFCADTEEEFLSCYADYGERITGLVHRDQIYGAQFHPEKSGGTGLRMLKNFVRLVEK